MGKKGPAKHVKRELAPTSWPIPRKMHVWAVKTSPGPHGFKESLPLMYLIRDVLRYAETEREAKMLIKQGRVSIDGVPRRDERFPLGFMDVVELPDSKQLFRVLPLQGGRLKLQPIKGDEAAFKLCRVIGKTTINNSRTQINLHDGSNIIVPESTDYKINDILQVKIPEREVMDHIKFEGGVQAILTGGRSQGKRGLIIEIGSEPSAKRTATIRTPEGEDVRTLAKYVFAVGKGEPKITISGG